MKFEECYWYYEELDMGGVNSNLQEMHDRAESDWMRSVYQLIKENEIPVQKEDEP